MESFSCRTYHYSTSLFAVDQNKQNID